MKKALMNASVASMIYKFNMDNIEILESLGYQVDVACNFGKENPITLQQIDKFREILNEKGINVYETDCPRSVLAIGKMIKTYKLLKKIIDEGDYDLIHTQSPIGGVICRLAARKARKNGTKVIYTAHGFHFYKGAPKKYWILFYPIEKMCSKYTDVLITINKEDYTLALQKMKAKETVYVPGVGVDRNKFAICKVDIKEKRDNLNISEDKTWLLNVGELTTRKNQELLIKAIKEFPNVYLTIAGQGELKKKLLSLIQKLNIEDRVKLLGYRTDIHELCEACDVFAFPSFQEGLSVALMEAMACGKPVICSKIRGNVDLIDENGGELFDPYDLNELKTALTKILNRNLNEMGIYNSQKIKKFDLAVVADEMKNIYYTDSKSSRVGN